VDADGFVYSGSSDSTVRKIDPDGNQVWSFAGHTIAVYAVAVYPGTFMISQRLHLNYIPSP
jgi:outer membrane protein assembly factor BamB